MWHRETGAGIVLRPGNPGKDAEQTEMNKMINVALNLGCRIIQETQESCTPMARCQELKGLKEEKLGLGEMMKICSRTVQAVWGSTKLPELWAEGTCTGTGC